MELQFTKQGGEWIAEFEATSDFNINLDRTDKGYFLIYLKGAADGTWATYPSYKNYKEAANIDVDVTALMYPKYIKVVSQSEVEKAIVTMEGESGGSGAKIVPLTNQCKVYYDIEMVTGWKELSINSDGTIPNIGAVMLKIEALNVYLTDILTNHFTVNGTITIQDDCLVLRDTTTTFDGVKLQLIEV